MGFITPSVPFAERRIITMANKGSTTQDATATQDDTYTYLTVPVAGYYNTASKLRTKNSNLATGFTIDRITVSESDSTGNGAACYSQKISFSGLKEMTIGSHSGTDYFIATLSNGKKYNLTKNGQVIDISDCTYVSFTTSWIGGEGGESASISNIVFS